MSDKGRLDQCSTTDGINCTDLGGATTDRLYSRVTIGTLPDNILLETFELYLGKDVFDYIPTCGHNYDGWQTLVHVCRRWRCVVFASPRRLDLKLFCTRQRSVNSRTLDIWPPMPIVIYARNIQSKEDATNIIAALRNHDRVCKIRYHNNQFQDSWLKEIAAIDEPFLALRSLELFSSFQNVPVLPDSFLGGSAPRLRSLYLEGIPYPSIGKLLSSTTYLVRLSLWSIPHSGYISPETIVRCLSTLSRLETLTLGFRHPRSHASRASRHPPPLTRKVLPHLTVLDFRGDIEYLEDVLSQIETPVLDRGDFWFFNQLVFDAPLFGHFIRRTEIFMTAHTVHLGFFPRRVEVSFRGKERPGPNEETLQLAIICESLDWQLSAVVQVLNSFLSFLTPLESLTIDCGDHYPQSEFEAIQWRELLRVFTSVKHMTLRSQDSVRLVAPALIAGERTTQVLPVLQNLFLWTLPSQQPLSGPVQEAIEQFSATRQHLVTVHSVIPARAAASETGTMSPYLNL